MSLVSSCRRGLQNVLEVGLLTVLAIEAFAPGQQTLRVVGAGAHQFSSGGKERLGRISKAGQADIRRLHDYRCHDPDELGPPQATCSGKLAGAEAVPQA